MRHNDVDAAEDLIEAGATLDTRATPVSVAVLRAGPSILRGLIEAGARVERWKGERYTPLYDLVNRRARTVADTREEYVERLRAEGGWSFLPPDEQEARYRDQARDHLTPDEYFAMLDMLIAAGADLDAPGDNGTTALFWAGPESARRLLAGGANPDARDTSGSTPLHYASDAAKARVLVEGGADPNAMAEGESLAGTPLQIALLGADRKGLDLARELVALGADPAIRSRDGRPTIQWCTRVPALDLALSWGLDPHECGAGGETLLHALYAMTSPRAAQPAEVAMIDRILELGVDINATDHSGQTALHRAAATTEQPGDIALLLDRGADPNRRDGDGKRPVDRVPRRCKEMRARLREAAG